MQSGTLLVDLMKLQNVFNFEVQKLLKAISMNDSQAMALPSDRVMVKDEKLDCQVL